MANFDYNTDKVTIFNIKYMVKQIQLRLTLSLYGHLVPTLIPLTPLAWSWFTKCV